MKAVQGSGAAGLHPSEGNRFGSQLGRRLLKRRQAGEARSALSSPEPGQTSGGGSRPDDLLPGAQASHTSPKLG